MEESIKAKITNLAGKNNLEIIFMEKTVSREDRRKNIPIEYCCVWDEISMQTNSLILEDLGEHDEVHFTTVGEPIHYTRIALDHVMKGYAYLVGGIRCMYDYREWVSSDDPDKILDSV